MKDEVYWVFTLDMKPEKFDEFKALVSEIVAATSEESGTLTYEYSVSEDRKTVHIFERYRDSDAFVSHVENTFARFAQRFLELVTVTRLVVYGSPTEAAREKLNSFGAVYMTKFEGFSR